MKLSELANHNHAADVMQRALQNSSPHHAYLMICNQLEEPERVALAAFSSMNCTELGPKDNCEQCYNCQAILDPERSYSELITLDTADESIGIDEVRQLEGMLAHYTNQGQYRGVLIRGAQNLTIQAQNALLKSIEEPPGHTVFFLLTTNIDAILLTIRSRCQLLRFPPQPFDPEQAFGESYAEAAQGLNALIFAKTAHSLIDACQVFAGDKQMARHMLSLFEIRLFDMQALKHGADEKYMYDAAWIRNNRSFVEQIPAEDIESSTQALAFGRQYQSYNINLRLIAETAFLALHKSTVANTARRR